MTPPSGRAESALNAKIAQYDEDMNARHSTLEELKAAYAAESAEYSMLKGWGVHEILCLGIHCSHHIIFQPHEK